MKKIASLFRRDYEGDRLVIDEVVEGSEWVTAGEGTATLKVDGTCCMVKDGLLYKRYDRKLNKAASKRRSKGQKGGWAVDDFKPAPDGWVACEDAPNVHTGHWPGWLLVTDDPVDKYHREAWDFACDFDGVTDLVDGTYELVGPKVQGNPYGLDGHRLWKHGETLINAPRTYDELREWFKGFRREGIVWHHPDGRMVKIKRKDFGYPWP